MKAEAVAAHEGSKLHSLASTSAFLFSGGADKVCARLFHFRLKRLMSCARICMNVNFCGESLVECMMVHCSLCVSGIQRL